MQYHHKHFTAPKKLKTVASHGKVTLTTFWVKWIQNLCLLVPSRILSATLECCKNCPDMHQAFLQHNIVRLHMSAQNAAQIHSLIPLSRIVHPAPQILFHLPLISSENWRNIWVDITSCQTMKLRQQWRCGSVHKMQNYILIDSWKYLNIGGSVWATELILLRSNCITLQKKFQEKCRLFFHLNMDSVNCPMF